MSDDKPAQRKYATAVNPSIHAVLKGLYRFATEKQATDRLRQLKEHFVTSKRAGASGEVTLWIRGYAVTEAEEAEGFMGHFAQIGVVKKGDKFTLRAEKKPEPLATHPQRKRPKQSHPDWGHPILRGIKKKRIFETMEEASHELMRLHEEFPEISIPAETQLMIILYEKLEGIKSPVQKYKFEVKAMQEGGFIIAFARNERKAPVTRKPLPGTASAAAPTENQGYFTAMVKLKRKKRPGSKPTA
jgi:hypothetical protein